MKDKEKKKVEAFFYEDSDFGLSPEELEEGKDIFNEKADQEPDDFGLAPEDLAEQKLIQKEEAMLLARERDCTLQTRNIKEVKNMNKKEEKIEEKTEVKRCPFNEDLACENCRLFIHISRDLGKVCSINYSAMRSI